AADNAVYAGNARSDPTFVPEMWQVRLPQNVVLLMSARTHRRSQLKAPTSVTEVELLGFDPQASAENLRRSFPDAETRACRQFHEASKGNPRVQFYVLEAARQEGLVLDEVLHRARRTPYELFDDLVNAALIQVADQASARQC